MTHIQAFSYCQSSFYTEKAHQQANWSACRNSTPSTEYQSTQKNKWSKKKPIEVQTYQIQATQIARNEGMRGEPMDIEGEQDQNPFRDVLLDSKSNPCIQKQPDHFSSQNSRKHLNVQNQIQMSQLQQQIKGQPISQEYSAKMRQQPRSPTKHTTPNTNTSDKQNQSFNEESTTSLPGSVAPSQQNTKDCQNTSTQTQTNIQMQSKQSSEKIEKGCYIAQVESLYGKNRKTLIKWLKVECVKLDLIRQAFANAVYLMDTYYKSSQFNSNQFLILALVFIIISSKMNQKKVLYVKRMATNCCIEVNKMMQTEQMVLKWFKYKMNPYNFAKILNQYMWRWDQKVKQQHKNYGFPRFLEDSRESFLLYQKIYFLCENYLIEFKELLKTSIRLIFEQVLKSELTNHSLNKIFNKVFEQENEFAKKESEYVYEWSVKSEEEVKQQLKGWMYEFQKSRESLVEKYGSYKQSGRRYSQFINIQL